MEKKLLLIDDSLDIIEILLDSFLDIFDLVETAYSVDEACKILDENTFSVIILDINLNNRNGAEIVKYILDSPTNPNKDTPIVIVSGIITPKFIEQYRSRFSAIILKPFDHNELKQIVSDILNSKMAEISNDDEEITSNEPVQILESTPEAPAHELPEMQCAGPFSVDALKEQVSQVMVGIKKNTKLKQLFKQAQIDRNADNYILSHVNMIINISAAICTKMDWSSDKTLEKFVYAAYLHDMALSARPDLARINTLEKLEALKDTLTADEYKIVFDHPNIAAKTIASFSEIPPDVDIMIRQHHETGNERGFPTKCGYQKITPFSAVFIVAHALADYIIENPKWTMDEFIKKNKSRLHGSHFTKIVRSLTELK